MRQRIALFILVVMVCLLQPACVRNKPADLTSLPLMRQSRLKHLAVSLQDGRVLLMGGYLANDAHDRKLLTAEIFNPVERRFLPAGTMRFWHGSGVAVLLRDGRVLVSGGEDLEQPTCRNFAATVKSPPIPLQGGISSLGVKLDSLLATGELYDPKTGRFSLTGHMAFPRLLHQAVLLTDGRVFITGGMAVLCCPIDASQCQEIGEPRQEQEIYDPKSGRFTPTVRLQTIRSVFGAASLPEDRVLVIGADRTANAAAEIVDIKTQSVRKILCPPMSLFSLQMAALPNGKVFTFSRRFLYVFNPKTEAFTAIRFPEPIALTYIPPDSIAVLPSNKILFFGAFVKKPLLGAKSSVFTIYNADQGKFHILGTFPASPLRDYTLTPLPNHQVLLAGGCDYRSCYLNPDAWLIHY